MLIRFCPRSTLHVVCGLLSRRPCALDPPSRKLRRGAPTAMHFSVSSDLGSIIRAGVLWLDGATVVDRGARLNAPLAAAEAAVRINPPAEVTAVRTMYKRVGL